MRPYPAYKDSGVEWLGEVPEGWEVKRLRHLVRVKTDKAATATNPIALENIESWSGRIIPTDTEFQGDGVAFEAGDILFGKLRPYLAKVAIAHCPGEAVGDFHVLRPSAGVLPRFMQLGLLTPSVISIIDGSTYGSKMPRASWDFMADLLFALPPLPEQQAIARFLDKEVAKIDALVAEQRRLIALLAEKRQAVISHAVTKGLNPATPLKPSGIDWLGDIPEGWEAKQVRHFAEVLRGKFTHRPRNDPAFYDGEYPFVQTGDITGAEKFITAFKQTLNEKGASVSKEFPRGTLVMAIAANIGDVAILDFPAYFPDSIVGLLPRPETSLNFIFYLMQAMKQPMMKNATISTQMNLNVEQISSLSAACPPLAEQMAIASYLDEASTKFASLTAAATSAISLLQERRAALISAAVTGKIDLRPHFAQSLSEPETA